ncbi:MAG: hypothetical protein WCO75_04580 [Planctomycetota bacterium]
MNQLLLFLRSLAIGFVLFLVLAFFAAKFFGGTLFRATPRVDFPAVTLGGHAFFLSVSREEGKSPTFCLRQMDPTDASASVLLVPQSDREADAWTWAEVMPLEGSGPLKVRYTQRDGRVGNCEVTATGTVTFAK